MCNFEIETTTETAELVATVTRAQEWWLHCFQYTARHRNYNRDIQAEHAMFHIEIALSIKVEKPKLGTV